jgi:hypothetical protein
LAKKGDLNSDSVLGGGCMEKESGSLVGVAAVIEESVAVAVQGRVVAEQVGEEKNKSLVNGGKVEEVKKDEGDKGALVVTRVEAKRKRVKKVKRTGGKEGSKGSMVRVGVKRSVEDMEVEESGKTKKARESDVVMSDMSDDNNILRAGLSEQLRGSQ